MTEKTNSSRRKYPVNISFPLIIIFIGVILLLTNLDMIPGNAWGIILRFWPLLFIFGALDDLLNRKWIGAVFNTGIGVILLLANFGFFSLSTWEIVVNYWPILLIALGLEIIFKRQSAIGSIIGVGFSILVVLGFLWFILQGPFVRNAVSTPLHFDNKDVEKVELSLETISGKLILNEGKENGPNVTGEVYIAANENLDTNEKTVGKSQEISITSTGYVVFPSGNMSNGFPWELSLNPNKQFLIDIDQIVGEQILDLSEIALEDMNSELVVGKMEVVLPKVDSLDAKFECIIGEMVLIIPDGISVRINVDTGLTAVSLGEGFAKDGDIIFSEDARVPVYNLEVNLPLGSLRVEHP